MQDRFVAAPGCTVPTSELSWRFSTSGGPGGQHANRSSTRATAIFDIAGSPSLDDEQRARLTRRFGAELTVMVDETRSQTRNRELAIERLEAKLATAFFSARARRPSKPSKASQQRRLDEKKHQGQRKAQRQRPTADD